jgi:hypothetical protein
MPIVYDVATVLMLIWVRLLATSNWRPTKDMWLAKSIMPAVYDMATVLVLI